ncbi:MAG: sigma-54 dependent transcriptional regulator [Proteobacteria bacterium]|nr:sigma-54 dependent transcriptional regulator [Pseudomonadota bacterium]MBU1641230.1 sigma-54 dependent transcriptional regulator [Pseudomonadota bacterium]
MLIEEQIHILIVDDEQINLENISHVLSKDGYRVATANCGRDALEKVDVQHYDLVVTDLRLGDMDGVGVMEYIKQHSPDTEVVVVTGYATVNSAVEAMSKGAFYYLPKPFSFNQLREVIRSALEKSELKREITHLRQQLNANRGATQFIGHNPAILKLKDDIAQVAQLDCNVMINGETGTGKELVARTIYELSPRCQKRFLPINCGALTEELMLNELFGHEKDAFTGASKWRKGLLESAHGGVVLLDEVGEMPLMMQVKLLRVLQEKKIIRVGGTEEIPVDVRILAATNRDLKLETEQKRFRTDLYYRLNVVSLYIPPLRSRKDDIPALVRHFLAKYPTVDGQVKTITDETLQLIMNYDFPGNVRELENVLERALAMCNREEVRPEDLSPEIRKGGGIRALPQVIPGGGPPRVNLDENERNHILAVLKMEEGNQTRAAKILGIARVSLWRKLKKYQDEGYDVEAYLRA